LDVYRILPLPTGDRPVKIERDAALEVLANPESWPPPDNEDESNIIELRPTERGAAGPMATWVGLVSRSDFELHPD
jgi:hypothetical protein